jgi:hypothetical protein
MREWLPRLKGSELGRCQFAELCRRRMNAVECEEQCCCIFTNNGEAGLEALAET